MGFLFNGNYELVGYGFQTRYALHEEESSELLYNVNVVCDDDLRVETLVNIFTELNHICGQPQTMKINLIIAESCSLTKFTVYLYFLS